MAAATKSKRPWEEDVDVNSDAITHSGRSSISSQHVSAPEPQYEKRGSLGTHTLPSLQEVGQWTIQGTHEQVRHRHSGGQESEGSERQYNYQSIQSTPSKRQRIGDTEVRGSGNAVSAFENTGLRQLEGFRITKEGASYYGHEQPAHESYNTGVSTFGSEARGPHDTSESPRSPYSDRYEGQGPCKTCGKLKSLVLQAASIIDVLFEDISNSLTGNVTDRFEKPESKICRRPAPHTDLYQSWLWVVDRMHASVQVGKELVISRHRLLQGNRTTACYNQKEQDTPPIDSWKVGRAKDEIGEAQGPRGSPPLNLDISHRIDNFRTPSQLGSERRNTYTGEYMSKSLASSLHASTPLSEYRSAQPESPVQHQSSKRQLPPPGSLNFPASSQFLPPLSPALSEPKSPHTEHLQDLQHQLSTKLLAHQILQGEHEKLLAAYSRSQIRCAALDKKSQVSDAEIMNLAEERDRLRFDAESLEAQVEELQRIRDEAQKESAINSTQYLKIMSMSSILEAQRATDQKKWKAEREAWLKEKEELLATISKMSSQSGAESTANVKEKSIAPIAPTGTAAGVGSAPPNQEACNPVAQDMTSTSVEDLRTEILQLRKSHSDSLAAWHADSLDLKNAKDALAKLVTTNDRMNLRRAELRLNESST